MADNFSNAPAERLMSSIVSVAVAPVDGTEFDVTRLIHCNIDGAYALVFADDSTASVTLVAGIPYTYRIKAITSGSAGGVLACY